MKKALFFAVLSCLVLVGCTVTITSDSEDDAGQEMELPQDEVVTQEVDVSGSPKRSVLKFVNNVLVDVPFDYDTAAEYLAPDLKDSFNNESGFVPLTFGIQETPNEMSVAEAEVYDDSATVRVTGYYEVTEKIWEFTVIVYEGEWKISEIEQV